MQRVWISSLAVAHPPFRITQEEAARRVVQAGGEARRVAAIARGTKISRRAMALSPDEVAALGSIEERNRHYQVLAPRLAAAAASSALSCKTAAGVGFLATSSCTGYMVPGLDVSLAQALQLPATVSRLPITEAGCAGGVVAIARVADHLRSRPGAVGLAVASEICSLAVQAYDDPGNLTSTFLFADGAGAAVMHSREAMDGAIEVVDSLSLLVPDSQDALGFALTDRGFYPLLARDLAGLLPGPSRTAVAALLQRHGLRCEDLSFWLVHPGGPKILESIQQTFGLCSDDLRWSWQSMSEYGNTSSAAIFDVLRRYREDEDAPRGWGLVIAFGPGVSLELLLVRR